MLAKMCLRKIDKEVTFFLVSLVKATVKLAEIPLLLISSLLIYFSF